MNLSILAKAATAKALARRNRAHQLMAKANNNTVQGTNDCSILSKHAMCHAGYMRDDFIDAFTLKAAPRRVPLINRGYYVRMKAVETLVLSFLQTDGPKQIVSIGAGFDTLYFRLRSNEMLKNTIHQCYLVEIDFEEVAERKKLLMLNNPKTSNYLSSCHISQGGSAVKLSSPSYSLIGVDLSKTDLLYQIWDTETLLLKDSPTLILSECVMTYMEHHLSTKLIGDIRNYFSSSVFITYEQVEPSDAFGQFMRTHFDKLNSSLKAITTYGTVVLQKERYKKCGYSKVTIRVLMFTQYITSPEHYRIKIITGIII